MAKKRKTQAESDSGPKGRAELRAALRQGNPEHVRALIESGADIRYRDSNGYNALIEAVHGRDLTRDPRLLELLELLVASGVDLSGETVYQESGLRVLSRWGRFDAVRILVNAGAEKGQLGWTPLLEAVALGSLADVQAALDLASDLEARDWWLRTPWLLSLLTGDLAKVTLLFDRGANTSVCGNVQTPPLFYAIQGRHPHVMRWLLDHGAVVHQTDQFGTTCLMDAAQSDERECLEILLASGANVEANANGTALSRATSKEVILRLLEAGADPADANQRILLGIQYPGIESLEAISPQEFRHTFFRTFGRKNPEKMNVPFWEVMIRMGESAYGPRQHFEKIIGPLDKPVWCASRFGQSITLLPDGRAIQIGGEHEDFYDPDFLIYNDVFVHGPEGALAIYGYPESVFPPTDFHTATQLGEAIYIIGGLGYCEARHYGSTPVFRLDLHTMKIERVELEGEAPGWINKHRAKVVSPETIQIWGGTILSHDGTHESETANSDMFILDLARGQWHRGPNLDES